MHEALKLKGNLSENEGDNYAKQLLTQWLFQGPQQVILFPGSVILFSCKPWC